MTLATIYGNLHEVLYGFLFSRTTEQPAESSPTSCKEEKSLPALCKPKGTHEQGKLTVELFKKRRVRASDKNLPLLSRKTYELKG